MTLSIESKGEVIPCHKLANTALATCCKVAVLEDLEIPPRCELMVPGSTMGGIVPSTGVTIVRAEERTFGRKVQY